jgi:hypothetical protein
LAMEIQQRFQPTAPPTVLGYELQDCSPAMKSAVTTTTSSNVKMGGW